MTMWVETSVKNANLNIMLSPIVILVIVTTKEPIAKTVTQSMETVIAKIMLWVNVATLVSMLTMDFQLVNPVIVIELEDRKTLVMMLAYVHANTTELRETSVRNVW